MSVTAMPQAEADAGAKEKKGGKKKLIIIVVLVAVLGGAGYWFFLKPSGGEKPKDVPGEVVTLDPVQINLAGGHYLSISIALQLTDKAKEADGSKALDATIELFSGRSIVEVNDAKERAHLKEELVTELKELYEGEVMDVYFTQFVSQ
jgi:flagellar FliL protein